MAKKMMWRDRLRWVASLPLPDQYALILVIFCVEADDRGAMPFLWRKLERLTRFERIDFERAISEFMAWGLMRPDGVDERFDADRYVIEYGSTMDLQLSLGVHGMLARIERLTDITDRQELALQKLVVRHYDWVTGLVTATTEELLELSDRWSRHKTNEVLTDMVELGYLTRRVGQARGYGANPHVYALEIRTDSREKPPISAPDSREKPPISAPDSREKPPISAPDSREKPPISAPDSREKPPISAPHPYTDYSSTTLRNSSPRPPRRRRCKQSVLFSGRD